MATLPGMRERTVAINCALEDVLGDRLARRLGDRAAGAHRGIRKVHDFLTVGAAAPLQAAGAVALGLPARATTTSLARGYRERRDMLVPALEARRVPRLGAAGRLLRHDRHLRRHRRRRRDVRRRLILDPGVAAVPGSSFYAAPGAGPDEAARSPSRRRLETLRAAA